MEAVDTLLLSFEMDQPNADDETIKKGKLHSLYLQCHLKLEGEEKTPVEVTPTNTICSTSTPRSMLLEASFNA